MRKTKEKPCLSSVEPVQNPDGTWNVDISYNAAFAKEFRKLTSQEPTPVAVGTWVRDMMLTDPLRLQRYIQQEAES